MAFSAVKYSVLTPSEGVGTATRALAIRRVSTALRRCNSRCQFQCSASSSIRASGLSGFAASALEVVLLLGFQALYGSLYRQVGLVVTVFMGGLAVGAWRAQRTLFRAPTSADLPDDPGRRSAMSARAVL